MGGGIGLMAGASHRVVTERTRMAMPEIAIGLFPDVGGSWFLNRAPGRSGLFLALTGAPLNAADALFAGLADFYLPGDSREALLDAIAQADWQQDASQDRRRLSQLIMAQAAAAAPQTPSGVPAESNLRRHFDEIQALVGHDSLDDIAARLDAEGTGDSWLAAAAANFRKGSPTSAVLAYSLLQRARHLSLREVFQLEFHVAIGCCAHHDFAEGIRALLVDKDRKPRWQPPRLHEVGAALVADHFNPRYTGENPLADLR
jgi:enoyl-CoA hydratase/carnithine racemase